MDSGQQPPSAIIHLDLDAFYCAVEELDNPSLKGKPFAVGGRPNQRGVVSSCSYAARQFGVRSAMPMGKAIQLCPRLIVVTPHHSAYAAASQKVMDKLRTVTSLIEQVSVDEAFLDVSELPEDAESIARRLQAEIRQEFGLPCSLGIAANKLVAKIATDYGKIAAHSAGPPNAITYVAAGTEAAFLAPLPVGMMWGVGPKTGARLAEMGIQTLGELAQYPEAELTQRFGKLGRDMAEHARGIYPHPLVLWSPLKSISQEVTFDRDVSNETTLRHTLVELTQQVVRRLQHNHLCAGTIRLKLRWQDFTTITRQVTLSHPGDDGETITRLAEGLFDKTWHSGRPVRLIGVGVSGLSSPPRQLSLWDQPGEKDQRLHALVDELQERFGKGAVFIGKSGGENPPS